MFSALDIPGTPHNTRYVGAMDSTSNSTQAFSNNPSLSMYLSVFKRPWWVVDIVRAASCASWRSTAMPSAEPSSGSVPEPTSSRRTKHSCLSEAFAWARMRRMRAMCAENVERDCVMDWSSPISAMTSSYQGTITWSCITSAGAARTRKPALAMRAAIPRVFSTTVLPPVFGPVITTERTFSGMVTSMGIIALLLILSLKSGHTSKGCTNSSNFNAWPERASLNRTIRAFILVE
mmetsp:Transcript_55377/g.98235  ORF Transcript_55377/g.98235 Transcript_55377/m.98235 type:complete len:234 (-) Transcript_55377:229-930(-)